MEVRGGSGGGGGQFLKGAGESQIEMDRRLFRKQLSRIEAEMAEVAKARDLYRAKRKQRDVLPIVAIVGYTNAGDDSRWACVEDRKPLTLTQTLLNEI